MTVSPETPETMPTVDIEAYTFKKSSEFRHPQRVLNVIPGDFTQDGRLDLLVYGQSSNSNEISVQLYVALPQGKFGEPPLWFARMASV